MAKVGQGDPRWLVSNRDDGKNVGNWHWNESDLTPWAKSTLTQRLEQLKLVDDEIATIVVTSASGFEGDVTVSTRKGKKIYFYDLSIELEWRGELKSSSATGDEKDSKAFSCTGKVKLSDIEQDSRVEDFQFKISVKGAESDQHRTVKELLRTKGMATIGAVIAQFNTELRHHAGVASENAPTPTAPLAAASGTASANSDATENSTASTMDLDKGATTTASAADTASGGATATIAPTADAADTVALPTGAKLKTSTLKLTHTFRCRPRDLIDALTDPARVRGFTQDNSATVGGKAGDAFKLYDGTISGTVVAISENSISFDWRLREWPRDHFARIDMQMSFANDLTTLQFTASRVPAAEKDNTARAFEHYYWTRIKHIFGFAA